MFSALIQKNKSSFILLLVLTILPGMASSVGLIFLYQYEDTIQNFLLPQWLLFYVLCSFTMAFALTPTTFIALISGYFLGWTSLSGLIPSYVIASLIGYFIAGKIDKGNLLTHLKENSKINGITENLKKDELWVIFFCRISPALPFAMMNVFLSYMNVKIKNFVTGSLLGMLPRTLLSVWIGSEAGDIVSMFKHNTQPGISTYVMLGLLILSVIGLYLFFIRAVKKYQS